MQLIFNPLLLWKLLFLFLCLTNTIIMFLSCGLVSITSLNNPPAAVGVMLVAHIKLSHIAEWDYSC